MSFPRYPKYRASGADWFSEVPVNWTVSPLKHLVRLSSGGTPAKERPEYWNGSIPWASSKDLKREQLFDTEDHITQSALDDRAATLVEPGCILVVVRGMILAHSFPVTEVMVPLAINQDLKAIVAGSDIEPRYLAWLLRGSTKATLSRLDEAAHGTKALRMDAWTGMQMPCPPRQQQLAIVSFLDEETAKIEALVAEQWRLMELLKEKRQAVISRAVTKGLNPEPLLKRSGIDWLGDIPFHWKVTRLANVLTEMDEKGNGDLPILSVSIHHGVSDDELGEDEMERKVTRSDDRSKYKLVVPGDLVYNMMRAWQGGFGTVTVDGMVSPAYVVARPKRYVSSAFVEHLLRTPAAIEQMRRHSRGVTDFRLRLYWDEFKNIRIPLPPPREARNICKRIAEMDSEFDALTSTCEASIRLLMERRTALISAAVTGQIDVRGLVEPAVA